ncbi:MAG: sensor histidine kinase [Clostridiales bacterium]|nr:sensor histidine kinase [Clostridiales bacterium]
MDRIVDKGILFAVCAVTVFQLEGMARPVIVLLTALTLGELTLYLKNRKAIGAIFISYAVLCVVEPAYVSFLPLIFYDCCWFSMRWGYGAAVLFLVYAGGYRPWQLAAWWIISLLAVLCAYRTGKLNRLSEDLIHLRDTSTELNIVMNEKNRELMEKQEYEIHLATLRERNRIAREIHDNVGHMLSRCILQMGALMTIHKEEPLHAQMASVNDTLNQAMTSIRESVHDLHDESIDLKQSVLEATKEMSEHYQIHFEYDMSGSVPKKVKYCFITTVKEAMSNVVKHSNADKVTIILREHPAFYQMFIEDNGAGKDEKSEPGIGLSNMKERVESLRGTIHIQNEKGFKIVISIPKSGIPNHE